MPATFERYPPPPQPPPLHKLANTTVAPSRIHEFVLAHDEAFSLSEWAVIKQQLDDVLTNVSSIASFTVARSPLVGRVLVIMAPGHTLTARGKTFVAGTIQWATELPVRVKRHDGRFVVDGLVVNSEGWAILGIEEMPRSSGADWGVVRAGAAGGGGGSSGSGQC